MQRSRWTRVIIGWAARGSALAPVMVGLLVRSASAQSVVPPQLPQFLCANYNAIVTLVPFVLLVFIAVVLLHGLVIRRSSLVVDLVIAVIIALVATNAKTILASFQINAGC